MEQQDTLLKALAKAQTEFPPLKKDSINPHFKNEYVSLDSILKAVLPVLHKNGITLSQPPCSEGNNVGVNTRLIHAETGEVEEASFTLPLAKADPQGAGSAITYARRYALVSMLGLNVDDDDDGNSASDNGEKSAQIDEPQPTNIKRR